MTTPPGVKTFPGLKDTPEVRELVGAAAKMLTLSDARAQRDEALARVEKNAGTWVNEAFAFVRDYLLTHQTMFCDDLWDAGLPWPSNAKALGAVMRKASQAKLMEQMGYRASVHSRGSPKPVWRSLVCRAGAASLNAGAK